MRAERSAPKMIQPPVLVTITMTEEQANTLRYLAGRNITVPNALKNSKGTTPAQVKAVYDLQQDLIDALDGVVDGL